MNRDTIVIVENDSVTREILAQMFRGKYTVVTLETGKDALEYLGTNYETAAIMIFPLVMPYVDGRTLLKVLSARGMLDKMPAIVISDTLSTQAAIECYQLGAVDFITKPIFPPIVKRRVENIAELYINKNKLENTISIQTRQIQEQNVKLKSFNEKLIEDISNIVEFRNLESTQHVTNIKSITKLMALTYRQLYPEDGITDEDIDVMSQASALHDIGKICIPDNILLKPGRLSEKEFELMKSHTTKGCEILDKMNDIQDEKYAQASRQICRHHHERYDGSGYPDGLVGDDIPLSAQIVALADVYDVLVSKRVYKSAYEYNKAFQMITNGECGVFSPKLLACFSKSRQFIESLYVKVASE